MNRACFRALMVALMTTSATALPACRGSIPTEARSTSEMALIQAGYFTMGSNDGSGAERPPHRVWLNAYYIDKYEVTNQQYREFVRATGHRKPVFWEEDRFNSPRQPVVGMTWNDAIAYCSWAGKRLPTEAEWEKAARGGLEGRRFPWGDEGPSGKATFGKDENTGRPTPVGQHMPNGYGLYDVAGNVWEWCADWYDQNYYSNSPEQNPKGPDIGKDRVVRGGSWIGSGMPELYDDVLRCAFRRRHPQDDGNDDFGFRCAKSP